MNAPQFFLGTAMPSWLPRAGVPLFVSDTRLRERKSMPRAAEPWAADSGGFSELQRHGRWTVTPAEYVARLYRYRDEIGSLRWAAPQDWMCEPAIIHGGTFGPQRFVGTHLSMAEHQRRTVANFAQLRELAPDLPIIPVVQGWEPDDYLRCVDLYWSLARIDLTAQPLVGVGSVCRRQAMPEAGRILTALHRHGVTRLHGFGFKILGLAKYGHLLTSADSLSWSDTARKHRRPMPDCTRAVKNCANCLHYALRWRTELFDLLRRSPRQLDLWEDVA